MNTTSNMKFSVQNTVGLPPHHLFILRSHLFFHSNNISLLTYFEFIVNKNSQIFSQELLSSPDFLPPFLFIFGERFKHLLYIRAYMLSHFSCVQHFVIPYYLEKTLESARRSNQWMLKEINWIFTGRTGAEAEAPILWPPDVKTWLNRKDPEAGKNWRQEEKGTTEDEMVGWHHRLHGHEFKQCLGDGEGQGSLACCSPRGHKESDTTERLKNKLSVKNRIQLK